MAQRRVEVIGDARPEPVEIGIDEKPVSAGLDAWKRHWKQIGQRRPVEPVLTRRRLHEWQAELQNRIDAFIKLAGFRLRCLNQFRTLGPSPQMAKTDLSGRCMIGLAHQRRNGGSDLDAERVAFCREDARIRRAVRRHLAGLVLVPVQAVDADRHRTLRGIAPACP